MDKAAVKHSQYLKRAQPISRAEWYASLQYLDAFYCVDIVDLHVHAGTHAEGEQDGD